MSWERFVVDGLVGHTRGDGDVLALGLHGGPGLSDYTDGMCDEMLDGGDGRLRVARYQQRGQAPSTTDGDLTIAQFVADAIAVIDHFGAATAVVAGHSWGGHLALHIAGARPDRVAGLLIIDALGAVGDGGQSTMATIIGGRIGEEVRAKLEAVTDADPPATWLAIAWPGYFKDPASAPPMPPIDRSPVVGDALLTDANQQLAEGILERALPTLSIPSVHMVGTHSPIEPAANEKTAALMDGAMVELLDTGHFPWIEQPGSVAAAMRRLLAAAATNED